MKSWLFTPKLEVSHGNSRTIIVAVCFAATDAAATIKLSDICLTFACVLYLRLFYFDNLVSVILSEW